MKVRRPAACAGTQTLQGRGHFFFFFWPAIDADGKAVDDCFLTAIGPGATVFGRSISLER